MTHVSPNPDEQYTPRQQAEILTAGGDYFQFEDPFDKAGMGINTIAHALALTNRFGGHTREPYSVAEHSWRVSYECAPEHALWGLMHDASEAYITDVCRPAKALLPDYQALEKEITQKIADHYGLRCPIPVDVHRADLVLCATEARDLLHSTAWKDWNLPYEPQPDAIMPMNWRMARSAFLSRYRELMSLNGEKDHG